MWLSIAKKAAGLVLGAGLFGAPAGADEWDVGIDPDNGVSTDNALFHGSEQVHDLAALPGPAADQDWYLTTVHPFSSYQFVVDGFTGELDLALAGLQRLDAAGGPLQGASLWEGDGVMSLEWKKGGPAPDTNYLRVQGAACGTACDGADRYRARFYETTCTIPRFNNSGTQTTVLLVQSASARSCDATFFFMDSLGVLLGATERQMVSRALVVLPTASLLPNQSGSVRIAHTCGYGGLSGKAVSVEPATGFTFDTPMLHRPH